MWLGFLNKGLFNEGSQQSGDLEMYGGVQFGNVVYSELLLA